MIPWERRNWLVASHSVASCNGSPCGWKQATVLQWNQVLQGSRETLEGPEMRGICKFGVYGLWHLHGSQNYATCSFGWYKQLTLEFWNSRSAFFIFLFLQSRSCTSFWLGDSQTLSCTIERSLHTAFATVSRATARKTLHFVDKNFVALRNLAKPQGNSHTRTHAKQESVPCFCVLWRLLGPLIISTNLKWMKWTRGDKRLGIVPQTDVTSYMIQLIKQAPQPLIHPPCNRMPPGDVISRYSFPRNLQLRLG